METEKYRALLCAIDEGSLSAAADKLGYTPSGISRMVTALEDRTGFPLLLRHRNGISPTDQCLKLIPHMRSMVMAESNYLQSVDEINGLHTGSITIGTSMDAYFPFLSQLVAEFSKIYPDIHVDITEGLSTDLASAVENRRADFCIISKRDGDFRWVPIANDPLVALVPVSSQYAKLKQLPVEVLGEEPFIDIYHSNETDNARMLKRMGIKPQVRYSCTNCFAAASMIEAGLGITTENQLIASRWTSNIKILPLKPPQLVEVGIATPYHEDASPAAKRFIQFAEKNLDNIKGLY